MKLLFTQITMNPYTLSCFCNLSPPLVLLIGSICTFMRSLPLKLTPGSDLRLSIEQVGRREKSSGFVLGVVGNLSRACFQCPGLPQPTVMEGNLEIIKFNNESKDYKKYLNSIGITIVLVTHENDIAEYGSRIITMKDGKIIEDKKNVSN